MNPDAKQRCLFRLPVRQIKNAALRRLAIIAAYPFMVAITLGTSALNGLVMTGLAVAAVAWNVPRVFFIQQRALHRTIGPAWRGEPVE